MDPSQSSEDDRASRAQSPDAIRSGGSPDTTPPGGESALLLALAHELRNPLAAIKAALSLLDGRSAEAHRAWAEDVIKRQVETLGRLTDDLVDFSRFRLGTLRLRNVTFDLEKALWQVVEDARPILDARRRSLTVSIATDLHLVGDPVRLSQVFTTLLLHAGQQTCDGGIILLRARRAGPGVAVDILEDGFRADGVRARQAPDRDGRSEDGETGGPDHLGIGMRFVLTLVELHGGKVRIGRDEAREGGHYCVELPGLVQIAPSRPVPARVPPPPGKRESRRILIVDDCEDAAFAVGKLLRRVGHEVRIAQDTPSALDQALRFRPEIVVADLALPGIDGYQLALTLREQLPIPRPRLIAISGHGQPDDLRRSREVGFERHLVKPFDVDELLESIAGA